MLAKLPNFFSFVTAKDLIRLGKENDGGYLISKSDIYNSDCLIGLGISDDWSFESDFVRLNDIPVLAYDASTNTKFWIKKFLINLVKNPFKFYGLSKYVSYKRFFRGKRQHIKKFVGLDTEDNNYCTMISILKEIAYQNLFLKIDIESSEYRILDTLVDNQNRISGLVIEFHDCDLHLERIKNFLKNFQLKLVHIHANNYQPIDKKSGVPLVLELTFSRNCETTNFTTLPNKLDMPNNKDAPEINLVINN
jgi:hypothetical protein